jgi:uncharacterized repeat protein (TIGR03803 family)
MTQYVWSCTKTAALAISIACLLAIIATQAAQAQTFTILHTFASEAGGWTPTSLVRDSAGDLYGNAVYGGEDCAGDNQGCGLIFELSRHGSQWTYSTIYCFGPGTASGYLPMGQLLRGPSGLLYGTTELGGACGGGTVFQLSPPVTAASATANGEWKLTTLHDFGCQFDDGVHPYGGVIADPAGNLYGTTSAGVGYGCQGYGCGTVYKLTRSDGIWTSSIVYTFPGPEGGWYPLSNLTLDANGNLYGTTEVGGKAWGVVFKVTPDGKETVLHAFDIGDGGYPNTAVTFDASGNLYGCTSVSPYDGDPGGAGVFELSPADNGWTYTAIYKFTSYYPQCNANLLIDAAGNLYGTSDNTGIYSYGNTFKLAPENGPWLYTSYHDFNYFTDGEDPLGIVRDDNTGNIYGVTFGGNNGAIAYELTP